jgi:hypothetical protein
VTGRRVQDDKNRTFYETIKDLILKKGMSLLKSKILPLRGKNTFLTPFLFIASRSKRDRRKEYPSNS